MKVVPEVLAVVGPINKFGSGHLRRMEVLQEHLATEGIAMGILVDDTGWADVPYGVRVVLLDRRDTAFPPAALQRYDRILISIDNLGYGSRQAHINYAALPSITMTHAQIRQALKQIILPKQIFKIPNRCDEALIIRVKRGVPRADLVLHPYHKRLPRHSFLESLKNAESVACYYGQTLFESLYLGKKIFLYDISSLHCRLADNFWQTWRTISCPRFYFDGRGLERLSEVIKQAIHGGLPDSRVAVPFHVL